MKRLVLLVMCVLSMALVALACDTSITDESKGKDKIDNTKISAINEQGEIVYYRQPQGTYKGKGIFGEEYKVTFSPFSPGMGTLITYDKLSGEIEYKYKIEIEKGVEVLYVQSKKTGVSMRPQFTYNDKYDTVKLEGILYTK